MSAPARATIEADQARAVRRAEIPGPAAGAPLLPGGGGARLFAPAGIALLGAVCAGLLLATAAGAHLGTALPPFFVTWDPGISPEAIAALVLVPAAVAAAPALLSPRIGPAGFAATVLLGGLTLTLAVAAMRGGAHAWVAVFEDQPEAANEYLPALPALAGGLGQFLDRFAELSPTLPIHPSAHPPGMLVALHLLGIDTAAGMAALTIAAGAATAPLAYLLGRRLLDEERARVAALLWCLSPAALLYVATSADALFAALGCAAALALVARRRIALTVGPILVALASFFSYALLAAAAWAGLVVVRRDGLRRALGLGGACAIALAGLYGALYAATGFDLIGAVGSADQAYELGISRIRPYAVWVLGSPAAFLVAAGLPVAWYALRALGERQSAAIALAIVVAVAALLGFTKAETERIWLFLVPFACVAAAAVLPRRALRPALAVMAAQAIAVQLTLGTVW